METKGKNTQQLSHFSDNPTTLKQKLNSSQTFSEQAIAPYHDKLLARLNSSPLGDRIRLSNECKCGIPRLAQRQKTDKENLYNPPSQTGGLEAIGAIIKRMCGGES